MRILRIAFGLSIALLFGGWLLPLGGSGLVAAHGAAQEPPPGFDLGGDPTAGRKIYKMYCKKCHGKRGNGKGLMAKDLNPKPRDFTDKAQMEKRSDWQLFLGIKEGGPAVGLSEQMTAWKDSLTEQEMRDVAVYIRQFVK